MKKLLCAILCLVMILGMVPTFPAIAAESDEFTIVQEKPTEMANADNAVKGVWYNNGSTLVTTPGSANYVEIVQDGYKDVGALHVYQDNVANHDMSLGMFLGGQAAGTYTVKLYAKGDLGLLNQTCRFYIPGYDGQCPNLHTYLGTTNVADWTEISYEIHAASTFYYFIFSFSKYNWQTDFYVDNIQLLNADGVDILAGCGNFYTLEEITVSGDGIGQWPDSSAWNSELVSSAYRSTPGVWTPMFPTGAPVEGSTWPAWDSDHYAEFSNNGYKNPGSLHLVSYPSKNTGIAIGAGMTAGQTYTLGFYAKGTVNTGRVLAMYDNGGGVIISNTASFKAGWNYYEHTFTANQSQLNLVAADWGYVDIYLDKITLKDSNGTDLLAGCGDFCFVGEQLLQLEKNQVVSAYNAPNDRWSAMYPSGTPTDGTWPAWNTESHYGEIVPAGYLDAGALHLISAERKNTGVAIGVDTVNGETYTLGLWAKGSSNSGKVLFSYANGDETIIGLPEELTSSWSYYEITYTATTTQLNLVASDWGVTDLYIDNITLKGSDGVDLLAGYGNFCVEEISDEPETPPTQPDYRDPTEEGWIGRDAYTQLTLGVDYDYTFAVLGDIQHITDYTPTDLPYLFDYILDNKDAKNIQFVFGMGDTTNDNHNEANNLVEWKLAQEQFFRFNGVLPYTVIRGNHDVVSRMNAYFANPAKPGYMDQLDGFYQEGSVVNVWKEFSVAGVDYLSILIDYESSDSVLAWASDVIRSHPNHRVIVGTHVYLQPDGTYDNEMNPQFVDSGIVNNAQQVWDKLISQHENIFMVMSGHESSDDVAIQHKTGIHGNRITEIRVDSQYTDLVFMNKDGNVRGGSENGVGMVTMLYFKNDGTQVAVEHYSVLRQWYRQLQTFEIEEYAHYGWRYDATETDSYNVEVYQPATELVQVPAILQDGLGGYALDALLSRDDLAYSGTGVSIMPDYNMNLGTHTYALHSGTRTVEPSQTYTISYKIKGLREAGKTWTQIHFCRSALGGSDTWDSQWSAGQFVQGPVSDWQTVSYEVTMDEKTSAIEIYFIVSGSQMLIDDLSVTKKGSSENIITNGDFESGIDGSYPTGFYAMKTGGIGTVEKVSGLGVNGTAAVRVEPRPAYMLKTSDVVAVSPGTQYAFRYALRIHGSTTDVMPVIRMYDSRGNMTTVKGEPISGKTEWIKAEFAFQTAADTAFVQIGLLVYGGKADVDELSLMAGNTECLTNGNFAAGLQGFTGEFVQGVQAGTVAAVSSARPHSLIVDAKVEQGVLYAYDGEILLGTVDWLYGQLEHRVNFGLRLRDSETAQAVAAWIVQRHTENLWVIGDDSALLNGVLAANQRVRAVLDCTANAAAAMEAEFSYVMISDPSAISLLQQRGKQVILACGQVDESLLMLGADGILTDDALAAITCMEAAKPAARVDRWQIILGGDVGVKFQIAVPEAEAAETIVTITTEDHTTSYTVNDMTPSDSGYAVMVKMAAAQMTDEISVTITVAGVPVWDKAYTVRQYADHILAGDYDDATKRLVKEMLCYGAAAQTYFGYEEDRLANAGVDMTGVCSADIPETEATEMETVGKVAGLSLYGATLIFESKTGVRFYFSGDVTDCVFTAGGETLDVKEKNGMWYVEIGQISPTALGEPVTVNVTKGTQLLTVSYSPMHYIVRMNGKASTTQAFRLLLKAMYNYHLAACEI